MDQATAILQERIARLDRKLPAKQMEGTGKPRPLAWLRVEAYQGQQAKA
jgi:hypothetical protein